MILSYPGKTIVRVASPPKTAAEAKRVTRQRNEEARRQRQAKEAALQARQRVLDDLIEKNRAAAGSLACTRGPRLDVTAIYRARNTVARKEEPHKGSSPTPRRPRTVRDLAASYYGPSSGDALIPAGSRGGAR